MIGSAVNAELAALGRRQLTANVVCRSRDPRAEAAGKISKEVLEDRLKKLGWADIREHFTWLQIVCGMAVLKSFWEETSTEVGYFQNSEAGSCLECGAGLSSPKVKREDITKAEAEGRPTKHLEQAEQLDEETASLTACPYCDEPKPLSPIELDSETAQQPDYYGRPMGKVLPKGQTGMEIVSLFDLYPENSGIDVSWDTMTLWRQATPRSLDWIFTRYPHLIGLVEPEEPRKLIENHPVLGEWDISRRYDSTYDADMFPNHAMVYEVWQDRNYRFPEGRGFVLIGDCEVAAYDGPLYKKQGAVSVAIVKYAGANWEPKHREIWGRALPDSLISPQNRINMLDSLDLDALGRMGTPNMILPEGCSVDGVEYVDDGLGKVIRYRTDPLNPNAKPEILGGMGMPSNLGQMRQQILEDMQVIAGPQSIEMGEAPKNITTTSGLQLLGENTEKKRAHRERALISAFEKIWEHQLNLLWAFRVEPDTYESKTDDGGWEMKEYTRAALMGQTKVTIEKQAEIDKSIYQKEAVREAMADGLYMVDSLHAKKRILELKGLPTDVNEDINYQIDNVKKQWVDFTESGKVPVVDPTIDDPSLRYRGFATFLLSQEGQRLTESNGWLQILKLISGWEMRLMAAEAMDMQARQLYGTTDPMAAGQMFEQMQGQYEQGIGQYEQSRQAGAQLAQETGQAPVDSLAPPTPPIPPVFLPGDKADHIYGVWMQMIQEGGSMIAPQQDPYIKLRAVVEAYRLLEREKLAADMAAQNGLPAPGVGPVDATQAPQTAPDSQGGVPQIGQLNVSDKRL